MKDDRVIPHNHFLKLLDKAVDFSFVNQLCRDAYTPDFGRPAYEPEMMFKIIFLQFLYDVSDRRIEEEVNFNLVLRWFIGLAIDESPPDSSSLTRFRDRLGGELFTTIFPDKSGWRLPERRVLSQIGSLSWIAPM